ncbi:endonuclease/exonuclease/phosphatase family protein [Mesohalobacter halotolerans]|uniref:Endonuclease/exonuclease/phosphatase domain-containing protein n=1 Tax=Mesohalobacter halotolerans TaxID=1883405 RepID=A0A4U5TQP1_9FLAO|nr:endonuclease/exonuclease/phosphatase family protein [Mesohalobacter halotolerans]TKS56366.1 hypothetical protein FCN74_04805 [Mesohalobacter halotolerans]
MKKLSLGYRILYFVNVAFAILLALSYLTSFVSPRTFSLLALINFSIPLLWVFNICFALIWLVKLKKYFFLSFIVIALGWFHFQKLFVLKSIDKDNEHSFKVMSYNVMQFYSLKDNRKSTYKDIESFIYQENPAILCMQELKYFKKPIFKKFKYNTLDTQNLSLQSAIYSHYPILDVKRFDFEASGNSAIYADIKMKADTIRVFSAHFQSLNLKPDIATINEEPKEKLIKRLQKVFEKQLNQFDLIKEDVTHSPYPVLFCADMNNTALSYLYQQITDLGLKDSFLESGKYYGKTFNFGVLPVRIDMILLSDSLDANSFKNYDVDYSDHFPVMAEIKL